jgi:hypothetical protein
VSLKKQYLKSRDRCKVTFRLPKAAAPGSCKIVHIVGEFNDWSTVKTPMKRLKNGEFKAVVDLIPGRAYQFRYLIDQTTWENDWEADRYVKSDFGRLRKFSRGLVISRCNDCMIIDRCAGGSVPEPAPFDRKIRLNLPP